MLDVVESFASLFVPFYFLHAGLSLRREDFGLDPWPWVARSCSRPSRCGTAWHRRIRLGETLAGGVRVGASILPSLVLTLVLAQILRERFAVPSAVFGG